ncbi:MAG TPA: polysaccharide deacetylase family protein [Candidatus Saccharimonadia bacterium]|nr:polysaccharide deacetylase family protein [Candidatus Saccharimonadia bacterium]
MNHFSRIASTIVMLLGLGAPLVPAAAAEANLVANPSAETAVAGAPTGWLQGQWGTNTPTFSYTASGAEDGAHALSLTVTGYADGDAKWYFAPVAVTPGTVYTASEYYQSTVATNVIAQIDDGAGHVSYLDLSAPATSSTWRQTTSTFTAPQGAKNVTIFHVLAANGTLTTDNFSLSAVAGPSPTPTPTPTPVPTPSPTPAPTPPAAGIPNPSVETAVAGQPQGWSASKWGTSTSTFSYLGMGHTGTHSLGLTVKNYVDGTANWAYAPQPVTAGTRYLFTDWYQATVASEVDIAVTMADGSTHYFYLGDVPQSSGWTQERLYYVMPAGAVSATVMHLMYQNGTLTTDDFSFQPHALAGFSRGLVTLTFDDGWTSQYTNGLPVMKKYGLTGTYYIISGYLTSQPDYLTVAQIKALKTAGNQIGSHTVSHPDLTTLSAADLTKELKNSQTTLTNKFGGPIQDFAAPYGTYNAATMAAVQKYYRSQRSTDEGYNSADDTDLYRLRVQNMTNLTTPAEFQGWIDQAARDKTWLIIVFHQVSTNPAAGEYNTSPADFDAEMSKLKASHLPVLTMAQAIAEVSPQIAH